MSLPESRMTSCERVRSVIIGRVEERRKGQTRHCFYLFAGTQHANCSDCELNMWHLVAWGMMDIQSYCEAKEMAF